MKIYGPSGAHGGCVAREEALSPLSRWKDVTYDEHSPPVWRVFVHDAPWIVVLSRPRRPRRGSLDHSVAAARRRLPQIEKSASLVEPPRFSFVKQGRPASGESTAQDSVKKTGFMALVVFGLAGSGRILV